MSARLRLHWRRLLGRRLHADYFANGRLAALNGPDAVLDNPDERLTQVGWAGEGSGGGMGGE